MTADMACQRTDFVSDCSERRRTSITCANVGSEMTDQMSIRAMGLHCYDRLFSDVNMFWLLSKMIEVRKHDTYAPNYPDLLTEL